MIWTHRLTLLGSAGALLAASTVTAVGQPTAPEDVSHPRLFGQSKRITLITGDLVDVTEQSGNRAPSIRYTPADSLHGNGYATASDGKHTYVYPRSALALVAAGKLDKELFNVTKLAADGYDDARTSVLPLIATYSTSPAESKADRQPPSRKASKAAVPAGSTRERTFTAVDAAALKADKKRARDFWRSVTVSEPLHTSAVDATPTQQPNRLAEGITKIWLDAKVQADLEHSVPQVGAPEAWKSGYDGTGVKVAVLDTGIDRNHPDVADRILEAKDFTRTSPLAGDGHGHGTHVASTIAGSGAASGGKNKGVAPGAKLLIGKVLADHGTGSTSDILAGMEWAAGSGASVINMSLGGAASDGSDPMSQAINTLTFRNNTLFVVAAGNSGKAGRQTIGAPGTAALALTVAAVDRQDAVAGFSSRGPTVGSHFAKPDISAPGVGVVAARSEGTAMGTVIDQHYTAASGTSMAAPHVAGVAALYRQKHKDHAAATRFALMGASKQLPFVQYDAGYGRINAVRALGQGVVLNHPAVIAAAERNRDGTPMPLQHPELGYTNRTDAPITLNLSLQGQGAPEGVFTLTQSTITVPAHGVATIKAITVDPNKAPDGDYGARVVARSADGAVEVTAALALPVTPPLYNVTVNFKDRHGNVPCQTYPTLFVGITPLPYGVGNGSLTLRLPAGDYPLFSQIVTCQEGTGDAIEVTQGDLPQLKVSGDEEITLDARKAHPVTLETAQPTDHHIVYTTSIRTRPDQLTVGAVDSVPYYASGLSALPTEAVRKGEGGYLFNAAFDSHEPWINEAYATVGTGKSSNRLDLNPLYLVGSKHLNGRRTMPLIRVGLGTEEGFEGKDVRGAAVVSYNSDERLAVAKLAMERGAAALITLDGRGTTVGFGAESALPWMGVRETERDALLAIPPGVPVTVTIDGRSSERYSYMGSVRAEHAIPDAPLTAVMDKDNSARLDRIYHRQAEGVQAWVGTTQVLRTSLGSFPLFTSYLPRPTGVERTEWVMANGDSYQSVAIPTRFSDKPGQVWTPFRTLQSKQHLHEQFFSAVTRPMIPRDVAAYDVMQALTGSAITGAEASGGYRSKDTLHLQASPASDSSSEEHLGFHYPGFLRGQLFHDGRLVAEYENDKDYIRHVAVPEAGDFRYIVDTARGSQPWNRLSTSTRTEWAFRSAHAGESVFLPLVQVDYEVRLSALQDAPGGKSFAFKVTGRPLAPSLPPVTGMKVWSSTDDGRTWVPAMVRSQGKGQYEVGVTNPAAGFVSLRVAATDAAGNSVVQTVIRAYAVRVSR